MKERAILFSGAMIRAILAGQKTQTRRIVKHQPDAPVTDACPCRNYPHGPVTADWYWRPRHGHLNKAPSQGWDFKCPYGQPGDRLWVREAWRLPSIFSAPSCCTYAHDLALHAADGRNNPATTRQNIMLMPRWASRILLEITDVRVERLQEISSSDALAEGVKHCEDLLDADTHWYAPEELYSMLWTVRHGWGEHGWNANPWVWMVEFTRVEATP